MPLLGKGTLRIAIAVVHSLSSGSGTECDFSFVPSIVTLLEVFMMAYTQEYFNLIMSRYGRIFLNTGRNAIGNCAAPHLAKSSVSVSEHRLVVRPLLDLERCYDSEPEPPEVRFFPDQIPFRSEKCTSLHLDQPCAFPRCHTRDPDQYQPWQSASGYPPFACFWSMCVASPLNVER